MVNVKIENQDGVPTEELEQYCENFVDNCKLEFPEEIAELFECYTRLIWQFKQVGKIYQFYSDITTCYGENGRVSHGADSVVNGTLSFMRSFPERKCIFVDIFAEGDPETGYHFGQTTRFSAKNTGVTKYGPGTNKSLEEDGKQCYSICECEIAKVEGRFRIVNEWVVESTQAIDQTTKPDSTELDASDAVTEDETIEEAKEDGHASR